MIALSSFRPFAADDRYAQLQLDAKASWEPLFREIGYVGGVEPEPALRSPKTQFVASQEFPTIRYLAAVAAQTKAHYVALINSDIVLHPGFKKTVAKLTHFSIPAATSRRWTFYNSINDARLLPGDYGLDLFIATPHAWARVSTDIPPEFRMGKVGWDNWLLDYWRKQHCGLFKHFTAHRCVFHPFHAERPDRAVITDLPAHSPQIMIQEL